ncbi:MAG: hypothetical protein LBO08_01595 [Rickettsiales bacterium]|nr:hypothetical protein [Rickettsiales bacterium]
MKESHTESGRSLMETIGYLAIAGILLAGTIAVYNTVRTRIARTTAAAQISETITNARVLFRGGGDYKNISVDYLVNAGALRNSASPVKNTEWSVSPMSGNIAFAVNFANMNYGDCSFWAIKKIDGVAQTVINGYTGDSGDNHCQDGPNQLTFIAQ